MRPAALLPFSGLSESENPPPGSFFLKPMGAALFSVMLHAVLAGVALALSFGGAGGGVIGNGSGNGPGSGESIVISGILFSPGDIHAVSGADSAAALPPKESSTVEAALPPEENSTVETTLPPEKISTAENIPASIVEEAPVAMPEESNSRPDPDAIPIASPEKPKREKKPVRAERSPRPPAANKQASLALQREVKTKTAADAKAATDTKTAADAKAADDRGNGQILSGQSSSEQPGKGAGSNATPGMEASNDAMPGGGSNDATPGGGSGLYSGAGGDTEGTGRQGIAFAGAVDSTPKVISRLQVRYPERARKQRITGHVLLRFHLNERGEISQLHVIKAEPSGVFEEAALAAVRQWRFAPAVKDGRPVPYWVELPMPFLLK